VDEEDIPLVAVGQKVLVKVDAFPNEIVQGRVSEITPKGDAVQRVYRIRVMLPAGTKLRVGMTTETNVIVRENEAAILVPASAVRNDRIFIVADGRIRARAVRTGAIGSRFIEIRDGVSVGETVVFRPTSQIRDGMRVRPVERAPDNGPSVSGRL
jgi:RND family efflux transporter MFP subunit